MEWREYPPEAGVAGRVVHCRNCGAAYLVAVPVDGRWVKRSCRGCSTFEILSARLVDGKLVVTFD